MQEKSWEKCHGVCVWHSSFHVLGWLSELSLAWQRLGHWLMTCGADSEMSQKSLQPWVQACASLLCFTFHAGKISCGDLEDATKLQWTLFQFFILLPSFQSEEWDRVVRGRRRVKTSENVSVFVLGTWLLWAQGLGEMKHGTWGVERKKARFSQFRWRRERTCFVSFQKFVPSNRWKDGLISSSRQGQGEEEDP